MTDLPSPVMPLEYAGASSSTASAGRRVCRWVGWTAVAFGACDVCQAAWGSVAGYENLGRLRLWAFPVMVVGIAGGVLMSAAGVAVARQHGRAQQWMAAAAGYAVAAAAVVGGVQLWWLAHLLAGRRVPWPLVLTSVAVSGLRWAAFPVMAWGVVRAIGERPRPA